MTLFFWVPLLLAVTDTEEATSIPWCSQCQSLEDWRPSWGLSSELGENRAQLLLMFERQFSRQDRENLTKDKMRRRADSTKLSVCEYLAKFIGYCTLV